MFSYGNNFTTNVPNYSFKTIFLFVSLHLCLSISVSISLCLSGCVYVLSFCEK